MPHGKPTQRRHAVLELADQLENPFVRATFGVAQSRHSNFYNDWMEQEDLDGCLPDIETLVNIILSTKAPTDPVRSRLILSPISLAHHTMGFFLCLVREPRSSGHPVHPANPAHPGKKSTLPYNYLSALAHNPINPVHPVHP